MCDGSKAMPIPHLIVGGVRVAPLSRAEITSLVVGHSKDHREETHPRSPVRLLFSANGHALSLAARNREFRDALGRADLVHADGQAIVFVSKIAQDPGIPERSATTDLLHDLSPVCAAEGLSFFLLGGTEDVNARCAEALTRLYPGLAIAGRRDGYFSPEQEQEVCAAINASAADILWVGLGKPAEQLFCVRNRDRLDAAWVVTCGGTFRFVTGDYKRAPLWMQRAGLEWLFRVLSSPRKLLWRYLTTNFHAALLLATRTHHGPAAARRGAAGAWYRDPQDSHADREDGNR